MERQNVSPDLLQDIVRRWIVAFNAHDVTTLVNLYADNAKLSDSGMKRPRSGRIEIEQWFAMRFRSMPSIKYEPTGQILMAQSHLAVTWTTSGRTPRRFGLPWLSRPFQVDGISVFLIQEGRILQQRGYYDHLAVVEQVLPPLKWLLPSRL